MSYQELVPKVACKKGCMFLNEKMKLCRLVALNEREVKKWCRLACPDHPPLCRHLADTQVAQGIHIYFKTCRTKKADSKIC